MLKLIISGCNGHMGQSIVSLCEERTDIEIVAGFNRTPNQLNGFPVFSTPADCSIYADAVIDFSNPANLDAILAFCTDRNIPPILCTTGYTQAQITQIEEASKKIPVFRSGNMSLGINLLLELTRRAAEVLGDSFDIEIVERHHNRKLDAPSGTALMLADAASGALPSPSEYVYERHSVRKKRAQNEIGISAVRGGTIVGQHEIIFAGQDEVVELKHTAQSRDVFANGSITAARFMAGKTEPGLYDMRDAISGILK